MKKLHISSTYETDLHTDYRCHFEITRGENGEQDEIEITSIDLAFYESTDKGESVWYEQLSEMAVEKLTKGGWLAKKCMDDARGRLYLKEK